MSSTRAYLRALALANKGIDEALSITNRALADDMEGSRFVTLLYARLTPDGRSLSYVNAGHPPGYVMTSSGEIRTILDSTAMPLGIMTDSDFPPGTKSELQSGDVIFLYTDGVTEANFSGWRRLRN